MGIRCWILWVFFFSIQGGTCKGQGQLRGPSNPRRNYLWLSNGVGVATRGRSISGSPFHKLKTPNVVRLGARIATVCIVTVVVCYK